MKTFTPSVRVLFVGEIANLANVLMRYSVNQPPGFAAGVRALAEACGVDGSDLTTVTEGDLETMLAGVRCD